MTSAPDLVAVGLGNPTGQYEGTRHNLGAMAVRLLAERHGAELKRERLLHAEVAPARIGGKLLVLAVPKTYMNESGAAVRPLWRRYVDQSSAAPEEALVIVHDELDLPPGTVRVKAGGGTAGNNGLRSIVHHLHRQDFLRVRIGIGKPPGRGQGVDHVLKRPTAREAEIFQVAVEVAADAVEAILCDGIAAAMNRYNAKS
ncbi:MAG: aminoacyl-tRNA hydrolase [Acidimicrobiales bacterium]